MRILITGGAGFIGSHLADELLARGHAVHVLDDLSTGAIDNIRHLRDHPRFELHDRHVPRARRSSPSWSTSRDIVYHLAAAVGVELIVESPVRTIETNVHGTEVVLAQASKKKKPVFVASTSEVYGKSADAPVPRGRRPGDGRDEQGPLVATPARRRSTSSWRSPTGRSAGCRRSSSDCSTPSARGRPAATAWSSRTSSARRWPASRSPSTATARRRAASATSTTSCGALVDLMDDATTPTARSSTSARTSEITIGELAERVLRARRLDVGDRLHPLRRGLRGRVRGHAPPHARHREDPRHHRLGAASHARPDRASTCVTTCSLPGASTRSPPKTRLMASRRRPAQRG